MGWTKPSAGKTIGNFKISDTVDQNKHGRKTLENSLVAS